MSYEVQFDPDPSGPWDRLPESEWDICGCAEEGGGGGSVECADCFKHGNGSPEGVVTGDFINQPYLDEDTGGLYAFNGTPGTNTGWV